MLSGQALTVNPWLIHTPRLKNQTNILQLPDAIVGDLDSLLPHVGTFYESRGVKVIPDPDQNSTDFGKCLNYISRHSALQPPDFTETHDALDSWRGVKVSATHSQLAVVALGGFGGRVDQSLHSVCPPHSTRDPTDVLL